MSGDSKGLIRHTTFNNTGKTTAFQWPTTQVSGNAASGWCEHHCLDHIRWHFHFSAVNTHDVLCHNVARSTKFVCAMLLNTVCALNLRFCTLSSNINHALAKKFSIRS